MVFSVTLSELRVPDFFLGRGVISSSLDYLAYLGYGQEYAQPLDYLPPYSRDIPLPVILAQLESRQIQPAAN